MKYLFYYIPPTQQKIKASEFQQGTEYFNNNITIFFFSKKQNKIKIQLHHTEILNYLILIAVIIYFVN